MKCWWKPVWVRGTKSKEGPKPSLPFVLSPPWQGPPPSEDERNHPEVFQNGPTVPSPLRTAPRPVFRLWLVRLRGLREEEDVHNLKGL